MSRLVRVAAPLVACVAFLAAGALGEGRAYAEGSRLAVLTKPDHFEIIVLGGQAAAAQPTATFDFLELPLVGQYDVASYEDESEDPTLKRVQLRGGATPRLRIQLHHSASTSAKIGAATRLVAAADGLHVIVPRKETLATWAAQTGATVTAPAARPAAPAPIAPIKSIAPVAAPVAPAATSAAPGTLGPPSPFVPPAAPVAAPAAPVAAPAAPEGGPALGYVSKPAAPAATAPPVLAGAPGGPPTSSIALVVGVLAAGGLLVLWARRRRPTTTVDAIRVIASRSLGGKSRVVLLAAGDRELLLSVSDRGTARLIGRWRTNGVAGDLADLPLERAATGTDVDADADRSGPTRRSLRTPTASPSVAGLLKLRKDTPASDAALANGFAPDADWARALDARLEGEEN